VVSVIHNLIIKNKLFVSPISIAEIYAGARPKEEKFINAFFSLIETISIDNTTGKLAGQYLNKYSKSHNVEIADSFIAATVNNYSLTLWTLNKKHYPMIKRSEFYKP
ncbi:MAG: type II toxin-antitoxin system VapC family toxin, partial [Melioribacteraceae bacterium]